MCSEIRTHWLTEPNSILQLQLFGYTFPSINLPLFLVLYFSFIVGFFYPYVAYIAALFGIHDIQPILLPAEVYKTVSPLKLSDFIVFLFRRLFLLIKSEFNQNLQFKFLTFFLLLRQLPTLSALLKFDRNLVTNLKFRHRREWNWWSNIINHWEVISWRRMEK